LLLLDTELDLINLAKLCLKPTRHDVSEQIRNSNTRLPCLVSPVTARHHWAGQCDSVAIARRKLPGGGQVEIPGPGVWARDFEF